jgi:hypothetical protein
MTFPLIDVNTDLLYILLEPFYIKSLFILSILFYTLPNLTFVARLFQLNAKPYIISSFFKDYLLDTYIWLRLDIDYHPTYHNKTIIYSFNFDNIFKVIYYIIKWVVVIVFQVCSIIFMIIAMVLSIPCQILWFLLGIILFQSN